MVCLMQQAVQRMMCFKQKIVELGKGTEHINIYIYILFTYTHILTAIRYYVYMFKGDFVSRFPDILY